MPEEEEKSRSLHITGSYINYVNSPNCTGQPTQENLRFLPNLLPSYNHIQAKSDNCLTESVSVMG